MEIGTQVLSLLLPICLPYIPLVGKDDGHRVRQQQKQKKRDQTRGAVEARHSAQVRTGISPGKVVGLGIRYPQAGYETLSSHYPLTPNCRMEIIRGSCLFWVPNPPGVLRQSENPSILPSHFPLKLRLLIGPNSRQIPRSRSCTHPIREVLHDQSRHGARSRSDTGTERQRLPPTTFTLQLWAPPSLVNRNRVMCSRFRPAPSGSRRG